MWPFRRRKTKDDELREALTELCVFLCAIDGILDATIHAIGPQAKDDSIGSLKQTEAKAFDSWEW